MFHVKLITHIALVMLSVIPFLLLKICYFKIFHCFYPPFICSGTGLQFGWTKLFFSKMVLTYIFVVFICKCTYFIELDFSHTSYIFQKLLKIYTTSFGSFYLQTSTTDHWLNQSMAISILGSPNTNSLCNFPKKLIRIILVLIRSIFFRFLPAPSTYVVGSNSASHKIHFSFP